MKQKIKILLLVLVILLGFVLRLYRLDNPIGDWHAFRQADTSAVSKVYVSSGIDVLHPKYFDISNIQSGVDNPEGYRFVEFPLFNIFQATIYKSLGVFTLEEWGRLLSVVSSTLSILFIFLLTRKHLDYISALSASFFFAVLPFSIFYGRVILPDPSTSMAILAGIYFFDSWITSVGKRKEKGNKTEYVFLTLAIIFTACAFLLKPFALFFTLPMVYLAYQKFGLRIFMQWKLYLFAIFSLAPLIFWRFWITQYPAGIPASNWLFNEGNIRFTGAFFNWILAERLGKLILGYFGLALFILGFFKRQEKSYGFFIAFLVSSSIYITVIARGNVQHDYYQILILPTICIFLGRGVSLLLKIPGYMGSNILFNTAISLILLGFIAASAFTFSWFHVRDYFNVNNKSLVIAGQKADELLPKNAKVIAALEGDTSFLYYINRKGWPAYQKSPLELKQMGATHIVIPSPTENDFNGLGKEFDVFYSSPEVIILSL